ncbi:LacI family gluconate utilization system Gnt-I transcriptional repressor [Novosphingobium sp. BK486]|nr:LacI family gluconate utilization system Gnt-I transcriptional repressor [Novosphingobium sp. BK258]MBB3419619.1 LacI family gluconate utilization system Gnt-I transcriptional repressor [Novosphingobium sp. BK267]MBB3448060.1 LacI family gluconate utilization system Gnt-I transcriptional repressor [Novosphingobium sp. BK352]MBB3477465.1 LacI family gluconate utilization system Gnt-I transcriptional repressor [Novosphingobium sp. BK369]MBB3500101.1 LacI family gluconate utilization system Gnt
MATMVRPSTRNPKLDDVAARAGVSTATVSRFLNNPDIVAAGTAVRIRAAIEEMQYVPNLLAGGLASSRSKMVAVLIPHLVDSLFDRTIETMVEELNAGGTMVMLALTGTAAGRTEAMIRAAMGRQVDAIVSTAPLSAETTALIQHFPGLFVQIWDLPAEPPGIAVGFSHVEIGHDLARFIYERGYRRPALVSAELGRARLRRDGFVQGWEAHSDTPVKEIAVDSPSRFGHARRVFAELRRQPERPDVVVCGSDSLAQGIIVEANAAGLKVPDQLAVVGFGNASVASDMRPTITTVEIDGAQIAREVNAAVRSHVSGVAPKQRSVNVGFRIIARESA